MLYGKYFSFYILSYLFFFQSTAVYGLVDPITGTFVVGAFVTGYFYNKSNFTMSNIFPIFGRCPKTYNIKGKVNLNNFFLQLKIKSYLYRF